MFLTGARPPECKGSGNGFLRLLREEFFPSIEKQYNVNHDDQGYFGHSLGGLFRYPRPLENDGAFKPYLRTDS
jgi:predicted alpha/beta superfamily hydrolase